MEKNIKEELLCFDFMNEVSKQKLCGHSEHSHPEEKSSKVYEEEKSIAKAKPIRYIDYTVQKGDSLTKISYLSGVSIKQIQLHNNLISDIVVQGQILHLPEVLQMKKSKNPLKRLFGKKKNQMSTSLQPQSDNRFKDLFLKKDSLKKEWDLIDRPDWHDDQKAK